MVKIWLVVDAAFFNTPGNRNRQRSAPPLTETARQIASSNVTLPVHSFTSREEAQDFIEETARFDANKKWYLLESVMYYEVPPTKPISKTWNDSGELNAVGSI